MHKSFCFSSILTQPSILDVSVRRMKFIPSLKYLFAGWKWFSTGFTKDELCTKELEEYWNSTEISPGHMPDAAEIVKTTLVSLLLWCAEQNAWRKIWYVFCNQLPWVG